MHWGYESPFTCIGVINVGVIGVRDIGVRVVGVRVIGLNLSRIALIKPGAASIFICCAILGLGSEVSISISIMNYG